MEIQTTDPLQKSTAVEMKNVDKTFLSDTGIAIKALVNINLTVRQGEFVTIIGPTGCGKTTLLNILAGLNRADNGRVLLAEELQGTQQIAYVFQHYTLFPWRTVMQNVSFGLHMRHVPRRQRKIIVRQLLRQMGLDKFKEAYPHELSGGMRQRTAIAQALALQPKLLLMDEPFGALDDATRGELQLKLIQLQQKHGLTIIFVTHNIDEALILGDKVIIIANQPGSILAEFDIPVPQPRQQTSKEFTDCFLKIRQLLSHYSACQFTRQV